MGRGPHPRRDAAPAAGAGGTDRRCRSRPRHAAPAPLLLRRALGACRRLPRGPRLHRCREPRRPHRALEAGGRRLGGAAPAADRGRTARATAARSSSRRSARRASARCSTRRCCSSGPAASARRRPSTSPPAGSARSASSTPTSWTTRTSSARSSIPRIGSGCRRRESARLTLNALNPATTVVEHGEWLTADNVERLIAGYDVIVDGTDNFDTRYVLNDAAVQLAQARRPRLDLPLGRAGDDVRPVRRARATAACTRCSRRPSWHPRAAWPASSACCPASPASSRRTRSSSCCSASARRSPAGCSCSTPWARPSTRCASGATPTARRVATASPWRSGADAAELVGVRS